MILEFATLKEDEEENSKNVITNSKLRKKKELEYFLRIKRNIIDLFLVNNDLYTRGKLMRKSNSESNLIKMKRNLKAKNNREKLRKTLEEKENVVKQLKDIVEVLELKLKNSEEMEGILHNKLQQLTDALNKNGINDENK